MPTPRKFDFDPPDRISAEAQEVWTEIVSRGRLHPAVDPEMLETYCILIVRWRAAAAKVADEGLVVDGGERRGAVVHPALAAERDLAEQIRKWSPLFNKPAGAKRRSGPMYDSTRRSIAAAKLHERAEFEAVCDAVLTLAWLIDEAQREGLEALQKATYNLIPTYVKGCAELQITPASVPAEAAGKAGAGAKVTKLQDAAAARRRAAPF